MKIENPEGYHTFCPKAWRKIPNLTGDYDFDAGVAYSKSGAMKAKIHSHISKENSYGYKTGYRGYSGYGGDD